jgi:polysaccharide biosynthesis/export protein
MKKALLATFAFLFVMLARPASSQSSAASRSLATTPAASAAAAPAAAGTSAAQPGSSQTERLELAISSIEYPVTPSDVYRLTYRQSTGDMLTVEIQVPGSSRIDLGLFGIIDASRLTFLELKERVEILVAGSYSRSYPSLSIESVGSFRVRLGGAGMRFDYESAWGLTRLGDIVKDFAGSAKASLRNVELARQGAASVSCDILLAQQSPESDRNPLLRPGDTITFHPAGQAILLAGEVQRPGSYELLPGEGLRQLIETFGGGATELADVNRLRVDMRTAIGPYAEYSTLKEAYDRPGDLQGCTGVTLFSRDISQPVLYFEGAVSAAQGDASSVGRAAETGAAASSAAMASEPWISCPIVEGQKVSDTLSFLRGRISPLADLSSATLIRSGSAPMQVDLASLMVPGSQAMDISLKANDRIYIPEVNALVTVTGAVNAPGAFAFQPTAPASFYITRAGGIDPERNNNGSFWVSDSKGKRKDLKASLQGGDRIYVPANAFGYNFIRYLPVVTGVITMLISIETLLQLINANVINGI